MATRISTVSLIKLIFTVSTLLFASASFAQGAAGPSSRARAQKKKDAGQDATVKVDGAAVYEAPNFDSPVMEYLDSGKVTKISRKIYPGIGGLGSFYKIRLRHSVYGYIADTDVAAKHKGSASSSDDDEAAAPAKKAERQDRDEGEDAAEKGSPTDLTQTEGPDQDEDEPKVNKNSFYEQRYLGLTYTTLNFAEKLSNDVKNAQTPFFGIKRVGPTSYMGGIPLDMTLLFTTSAPSFYGSIANKTSGYMFIADAMPFFPLMETKHFMLFYGFGMLVRYERWDVTLKNFPNGPSVDSEELAIGIEGEFGGALKLGQKFELRGDMRYIYEKQRYFGFGLSGLYHF